MSSLFLLMKIPKCKSFPDRELSFFHLIFAKSEKFFFRN